jgi:hypothetical protein
MRDRNQLCQPLFWAQAGWDLVGDDGSSRRSTAIGASRNGSLTRDSRRMEPDRRGPSGLLLAQKNQSHEVEKPGRAGPRLKTEKLPREVHERAYAGCKIGAGNHGNHGRQTRSLTALLGRDREETRPKAANENQKRTYSQRQKTRREWKESGSGSDWRAAAAQRDFQILPRQRPRLEAVKKSRLNSMPDGQLYWKTDRERTQHKILEIFTTTESGPAITNSDP